jgi:hypothetical protein
MRCGVSSEMVPLPPGDEDLAPLPRCAQCGKLSRPGRALCDEHWGEQQLDAARSKLRANALVAVDALVEIAATSTDPERVRAANSILDRAGIRNGLDLTIRQGSVGQSPADILSERLAKLQSRIAAAEGAPATHELPEKAPRPGSAPVERSPGGTASERRIDHSQEDHA